MDNRTPKNAPLMWALFALLTCAYLLAYSGNIESGDSRALFNLTASLYRYGDSLMDLHADQLRPTLPLDDPNAAYPLRMFDIEPLHSRLALPLYALADRIPGIGLVHTTWLFNIIITAATACLIYGLGRQLGYGAWATLAVALAYGLCTAAMPYSKTFFREPLSAFTIISAVYLAERVRGSGFGVGWVVALAAAIGMMLLTRAASLFALPALVVLLLPSLRVGFQSRASALRLLGGLLAVALVVGGIFWVGAGLGERYDILARLSSNRTYVIEALHGYLLSIGGSIWGTSPVLLLAIPGCVLLWWRGQGRYALALPLSLMAYSFGYANLVDGHWFGGLSWPPRFLIATIPLLMVGVLPAVDLAYSAQARRTRLLASVGFALLCAYGLWIQVTAVSLRWGDYLLGLPPESLGTLEWSDGLNTLQYLRWTVIPQLWGQIPLDLAWVRAGVSWWALLVALLLGACALWLGWGIWRARAAWQVSAALVVCVVVLTGVGLRAFYERDPLYRGDDPALDALLDAIDQETRAGDVIVLSNPAYVSFFMNSARLHNGARVISLPDHPGDRPSENQPPLIEGDNPELLVLRDSIPLIHALAGTRDRLWLVENFGPALPWSTRPVERFLATYYHPIRTIELSALVRLIEFDTTPAPDVSGMYAPRHSTRFVFGEDIRLLGYELPERAFRAGESVPLSLVWASDAPLDADYVMALYLRAADGAPSAQSDMQPGWGFAATSSWLPNVPVWDHRALRLPNDLLPGEYQVWVKVYGFDANFAPVDLPARGGEVLEGTIAIIDARVEIGSGEGR
jgi:hypothetical protein